MSNKKTAALFVLTFILALAFLYLLEMSNLDKIEINLRPGKKTLR